MILNLLTSWYLSAILLIVSGNSYGLSGYVSHPQKDVWILGGDIGLSFENYIPLERALANAKRGDKIRIIIRENRGGWASIGYDLHDDIKASHAMVTTEAQGEVDSTALTVLFSGDKVVIDKDGDYVAHLSYFGTFQHKFRLWIMMVYDRLHMQFYKQFITSSQWQRIYDGEDVYLDGDELCSNSHQKISENDTMCIIRGVK